jgi:hypothetical protein
MKIQPERRFVMFSEADRDPRHHTQKMQIRLQETMDQLREDIEKVDEPQLRAMSKPPPRYSED